MNSIKWPASYVCKVIFIHLPFHLLDNLFVMLSSVGPIVSI